VSAERAVAIAREFHHTLGIRITQAQAARIDGLVNDSIVSGGPGWDQFAALIRSFVQFAPHPTRRVPPPRFRVCLVPGIDHTGKLLELPIPRRASFSPTEAGRARFSGTVWACAGHREAVQDYLWRHRDEADRGPSD